MLRPALVLPCQPAPGPALDVECASAKGRGEAKLHPSAAHSTSDKSWIGCFAYPRDCMPSGNRQLPR